MGSLGEEVKNEGDVERVAIAGKKGKKCAEMNHVYPIFVSVAPLPDISDLRSPLSRKLVESVQASSLPQIVAAW